MHVSWNAGQSRLLTDYTLDPAGATPLAVLPLDGVRRDSEWLAIQNRVFLLVARWTPQIPVGSGRLLLYGDGIDGGLDVSGQPEDLQLSAEPPLRNLQVVSTGAIFATLPVSPDGGPGVEAIVICPP